MCACSVSQLCLTLWDSLDCSLQGSSVHGIFQARKLEWVAIPFSRGSSWPRDWICVFCISCIAGDPGSVPGLERPPGEGNGNPLQFSCLENPMDRRAWQATVHGIAKNRTQLNSERFHILLDIQLHYIRHVILVTPDVFGRLLARSLVGCLLWGCTESDMTEVT